MLTATNYSQQGSWHSHICR